MMMDFKQEHRYQAGVIDATSKLTQIDEVREG